MSRPFRLHAAALLALLLLMPAAAANAATFIVFGNAFPDDATATATITCCGSNTLNFSLTNSSGDDARITAVGFDLSALDFTANNSSGINGFSGTSTGANFAFTDGSLGNVPQFDDAVLDFGFTVGNSGNVTGGSSNDGIDQLQTINFTVSGAALAGFTEAQIAAALFVRFQRVGENGQGSDVGRVNNMTAVPEPATMLLFGTGMAVLARRKLRRQSAGVAPAVTTTS